MAGSRRVQLVMSEVTECFGPPLPHPLREPWHARDTPVFDKLFEETAELLAMFMLEEVEGKDPIRPRFPLQAPR